MNSAAVYTSGAVDKGGYGQNGRFLAYLDVSFPDTTPRK